MALTRNKPRVYSTVTRRNSLALATATAVLEGAAVGIDSTTGRARSLVTGDLFAGFAAAAATSVRDVTGANPTEVRLQAEGEVLLTVSGVVATSVGASVFATDDDTFALTGSSLVGEVLRVPAAGQAVVAFVGGRNRLSSAQVAGGQALVSAYGIQPATWYNGEINSVATSHIVADGDLSSGTKQVPKWWLIVLNAKDDVDAAQRLLDGGPNVLTVLPGQTIQPPVQDYLGATGVLTTAYAVCISTATTSPGTYPGGAYILSDDTAETIANALANMAKFEWSSGLGCTSFRATASAVYTANFSALMVAAGV